MSTAASAHQTLQHRARCLRALGVQVQVARQPLVAAPASRVRLVDDSPGIADLPDLDPHQHPRQLPGAAEAVHRLMASMAPEPAPAPEPSAAAAATAPTPPPVEAVAGELNLNRFTLRRWWAGPVLFIDSCDDAFLPGGEQLLANMARALGAPVDYQSPPDHFVWPPLQNSAMNFDASQAAAAARHWLRGTLEAAPTRQLLLMGRIAIGACLPEGADLDRPSLPEHPRLLLVSGPSVNQMLADGRAKAHWWRRLKSAGAVLPQ